MNARALSNPSGPPSPVEPIAPRRVCSWPRVAGRSFGVGLDLPWGQSHGFGGDPGRPDALAPGVVSFLSRYRPDFDHLFVSFQPKSRGVLALEDYVAAFDDLFESIPAYATRGLHHTLLNLGALDDYDRGAIVEFTNGLVERYDFAWVNEDLGIWSLNGRTLPYPLPPCLTQAALERATVAARDVVSRLAVPLLVEFPGFSSGACVVLGNLHAYDFFRTVVEEADACATLDTGHLLSYQWSLGRRGEQLFAELHRLPLERCFEIHLSGAAIVDGRFLDTHDGRLLDEQLELLSRLIERCPNLRCVTYEDPRFDATGQLDAASQPSFELLEDRARMWCNT